VDAVSRGIKGKWVTKGRIVVGPKLASDEVPGPPSRKHRFNFLRQSLRRSRLRLRRHALRFAKHHIAVNGLVDPPRDLLPSTSRPVYFFRCVGAFIMVPWRTP